ncbi:MAG: ABC transporter permease [Synechococcales bacterium]|nr:ABC transporter permease [Synechococcales bacterium]
MNRSRLPFNYLLRETWLGMQRGGWMNWAAISTVTVLLFLFGFSFQTSWQVERFFQQFGNQLELSVYLDTGVSARDLQPKITQLPEVNQVTSLSKETAWSELVQDLGIADSQAALKQLNGNPLVDELRVLARSPQAAPKLAETLRQIPGVDEVQYVHEVVQQVAQLNQGLRWVSLGVTGFLTLSAIAVITTTLRLVIAARQQEVEVMRLVGATRNAIYLPFICQGIAVGLLGAGLAWTLLQALLQGLRGAIGAEAGLIQDFLQMSSTGQFWQLPVILLGFGSAVGFLGSLFAVRSLKPRSFKPR